MNKRLTDEESQWMWRLLEQQDELSELIARLQESEQAAWEEVEQLHLHQEVQQAWSLHMIESQILMGEEIERLKEELEQTKQLYNNYLDMYTSTVSEKNMLKGQLQDALKVMQEAVNDIDCEYPQTALIALEAAIQRIQEKRGQSDKNQPKTISVACPECGELNSFNVRRGLGERESDWIKCSFCNVRSGIVRWLRNESVQEGKQS